MVKCIQELIIEEMHADQVPVKNGKRTWAIYAGRRTLLADRHIDLPMILRVAMFFRVPVPSQQEMKRLNYQLPYDLSLRRRWKVPALVDIQREEKKVCAKTNKTYPPIVATPDPEELLTPEQLVSRGLAPAIDMNGVRRPLIAAAAKQIEAGLRAMKDAFTGLSPNEANGAFQLAREEAVSLRATGIREFVRWAEDNLNVDMLERPEYTPVGGWRALM